MDTPAERYLAHLDSIFEKEPLFFQNESKDVNLPGVTSIVYNDIPEPGFVTGFTYGLSIVDHPDWKLCRPELCISVESEGVEWGRVAGYVASALRGSCPFCYGDPINFREQISDESEMDAFFVFAPSIIGPDLYKDIDIGADYRVCIAGLYPMYSDEMPVLDQIGLKAFWHHKNFDLYDVNRPRIIA